MIGSAVALTAYTGFLLIVFVLRTNRSSWVRFASRADAAGESLLVISVSCSFVSLVLTLLDRIQPWAAPAAVTLAGAVVLAVGAAVALAAQHQLGAAWRPGIDPSDRTPLVTERLYRHSRNPFYVGWGLVAAGVAAINPTPLTVAGFVGLVLSLEIVVRLVEEPALRATQPSAYAEYARRTSRFV